MWNRNWWKWATRADLVEELASYLIHKEILMDADKQQKSTTTDGLPPRDGYADKGAPAPINPVTGQHNAYWILSEDERAKGFTRPVRRSYKHLKCGTVTRMGTDIAETYARDPKYYGSTFCVYCMAHFPLQTAEGHAFTWEPEGDPVGSDAQEAEEFLNAKKKQEAEKHNASHI